MRTRSGRSSSWSGSTCSSTMTASSSGERYAASVARPSGGKSEYLIGRQYGLVASVRAGRMSLTRSRRGGMAGLYFILQSTSHCDTRVLAAPWSVSSEHVEGPVNGTLERQFPAPWSVSSQHLDASVASTLKRQYVFTQPCRLRRIPSLLKS